MKFKYCLMTQTQLGQLFGATSHEVGKWLIQTLPAVGRIGGEHGEIAGPGHLDGGFVIILLIPVFQQLRPPLLGLGLQGFQRLGLGLDFARLRYRRCRDPRPCA